MVDWQVTATTIYCPQIQGEVTIMVYKDWSTRCTFQSQAKNKAEGKAKCNGLDCPQINQYKEKLKAEENTKKVRERW